MREHLNIIFRCTARGVASGRSMNRVNCKLKMIWLYLSRMKRMGLVDINFNVPLRNTRVIISCSEINNRK